MDKVSKLFIVVVSSEYMDVSDENELKERLSKISVTKFSTADMINVTRYKDHADAYVIAFKSSDLINADISAVASSIVTLITSSVSGTIECTIGSTFVNKLHESEYAEVRKIFELSNNIAYYHQSETGTSMFTYRVSDMMNDLYKLYKPAQWHLKSYGADDDIEDEDDTSDDEVIQYLLSGNTVDVDVDSTDYISDFMQKRHKSKKKSNKKHAISYGTSRVIRAADSPKRAYRRHGVIICKEKNAIKKDRQIIKEFLKDFIPGDAEWKKDLRKDLLNRWMSVYVISKKKLKKLEREMHASSSRERVNKNVQRTLDMTRKMFSVPINSWNDPTR